MFAVFVKLLSSLISLTVIISVRPSLGLWSLCSGTALDCRLGADDGVIKAGLKRKRSNKQQSLWIFPFAYFTYFASHCSSRLRLKGSKFRFPVFSSGGPPPFLQEPPPHTHTHIHTHTPDVLLQNVSLAKYRYSRNVHPKKYNYLNRLISTTSTWKQTEKHSLKYLFSVLGQEIKKFTPIFDLCKYFRS